MAPSGVGTLPLMLIRYFSTIFQKLVISDGSRAPAGPGMNMVAPADRQLATVQNRPPTWNSGSVIVQRSPFRKSSAMREETVEATIARLVSRATLGWPVVPPVGSITATRSASEKSFDWP